MKSLVKSFLTVSLALITIQAKAEVVSAVKAAELACHRVDRLVVLKKIEKTFLSKFQKLELVELAANDPSGGKFSITTFQTPPSSGTPFKLLILIDETGKVIKHQVVDGGSAGPDITWSGKDPVTLAESGLHYVIEEQVKNEQIRPFAADFQSLILTQKSKAGVPVAELLLKSRTTTAKLVLTMDLTGKLLSKQVIP